jgi:hypothetical protein
MKKLIVAIAIVGAIALFTPKSSQPNSAITLNRVQTDAKATYPRIDKVACNWFNEAVHTVAGAWFVEAVY